MKFICRIQREAPSPSGKFCWPHRAVQAREPQDSSSWVFLQESQRSSRTFHMADLMLERLGLPESVLGSIVKLPPGERVLSLFVWADTFRNLRGQPVEVRVGDLMYEDVGAAIFRYPDKVATFDVTAWAPGKGEGWSMEFIGTNAVMIVYPYKSRLELNVAIPRGGYGAGPYTFDPGSRAPNGNRSALLGRAYETQLDHLLDLLRSDAPPSQLGLERTVNIIRLLDGLFRSSRPGVDLSPQASDAR